MFPTNALSPIKATGALGMKIKRYMFHINMKGAKMLCFGAPDDLLIFIAYAISELFVSCFFELGSRSGSIVYLNFPVQEYVCLPCFFCICILVFAQICSSYFVTIFIEFDLFSSVYSSCRSGSWNILLFWCWHNFAWFSFPVSEYIMRLCKNASMTVWIAFIVNL